MNLNRDLGYYLRIVFANTKLLALRRSVGRPTIEIDLMPDFSTNTKIEYHGINGWYPWIPMQESSVEIKGGLGLQKCI